MFSVRIVNSDFYTATPIQDIDICSSKFRETTIDKVPVIRIYGATPVGQKTCLHVHGVFPYIYVPYDGTQPTDKYLKQLAVSVDFALQVALGKASSSRQHVYDISVVKGIPFYGYHEGEQEFLRISLYSPFLVTRVVSLLQSGGVMNKVFQPYEAHIPYLLQFFMDYNLYGMNLLHASAVKFRNPVRLDKNGVAESVTVTQKADSLEPSLKSFVGPSHQIWNKDTVPRECILGSDVERLSFCELEVDVLASDILNKLEIGANIGSNPGLAAIWEDEQQRRRDANQSSQISGPSSQDRGLIQLTETEKKFKDRIKEIVDERDLLIQSQIGKLGRDSLSPQEIAALQDSICSLAASQRQSIADESLDADSVSQLLSQHAEALLGEKSEAESSQMVINEDEPVINQGIIEESQRSFSQELSTSMDKEMIDILASLAEDDPVSQRSALSQSIVLDQGDPLINEEHKDEQELSESEESIMMSQRVWDDIEDHSLESGEKQMVDERDTHMASQRVSGYNLEGMSDTWNESFLGENIPQLDGAADEHADGQEVVKNPGRKTGKGKAKQESSELDKTKKIHGTSTRIPVNSTKIRDQESVRNATTSNCGYALSRDDTETWGEMIWPGKPRALRTYSKRMSALRSTKSSELHVETNTKAKSDEKAAPSVTSEDAKHQDNELPAFSLFLSESSDSEGSILEEAHVGNERFEVKQRRENVVLNDNNTRSTENSSVQENSNKIERNLPSDGREILSTEHEDLVNEKKICFEINDAVARIDNTIEDDLTSEKMDGIASRELLGSDGENSAKGRINFAVEKNSSFQSCIPARTKLYSSPDKNAKNTKTRLHTSKQSLSRFRKESCPLLIRDVVELTSEISPHCSKDKGTHTRRFTLRKRKWSAVDKEDEEPSQEQKTDIAASLSVVRSAMPNLKVLLEDVAQNSLMDLKLNEARSRLRKKREALRQNFTHLVEKTSSSCARTQTQKQKRLSLRPRELKKSSLSKSTSPKRMEERVKKYGTLPVLVIKSPRKTESTYDSQLSENASGNQLHQAETTVVTSQRPCVRMGSPDNECASSQNWNRGGENFVGPRGRTETTKIYDVHTSGNEATALSKSDHESKDKSSKNEARRSLSLQRRGLKRKLSVKIEKGSQLTSAGVSSGANKKRKLSFKLEGNNSHTFLRKGNIDDALEDPSEKEKSLRFDNDFDTKPCNSPQVEVNVCSVDRRTKVGIRELDSNKGRLHDITCVPSSPREHDSSEDSPTNGTQPNSHHVAAKVSFAVCKSRKSSELSLPEVNIRDKSDNLSSELHCVLDQRFPEEKETELLANALFNMSFPSPLPCKEECSSPPDPSTPPLATTCGEQDLRDQQPNNLDEISNLESSLVGQIYAQDLVDSLISSSRTSSKIQPRETVDDCLSSKNTSATQGFSSLGILCPQIGETLIQFESMDNESEDKPNWQHETTGDKVAFGLSKNLESKRITQLVANKEVVALERSTNDENTHVVSNLEFPVSKSKSCGSVSINDSNGAMESSAADITDLGSVTTQSNVTRGVDSTECSKTGEVNSCDSENTEFVLKLTAEDDSFADAQEPANKSVFRKTKSSLSEGNRIQPCEEDKGLKSSQLPVNNQSNVCHVISSLDECNDIQQYNLSSEVVDTGINNDPAPKPANTIKEQTSITHGKENGRNFTACSNPAIGGDVAIKPLKQAPSSDELISTLQKYGLPRCKYQAPFCSDPDDIPASPREVGGRILRIESKEVSNLPDFESLNSLQGLQHWRMVMSSAQECGIEDIYHAMGDASNIHRNIDLKIALMGDGDVVVTPCRDPPAPEAVKAWARNKLLKLSLKGNTEEEKDRAPKTLTNAQESSKHGSLKGVITEQDSEKTAVNTIVSKNRAMEVEKAISVTSDSSIPSKQANKKLSIPPVDTTLEMFADIESEKVGNAMKLSNSSSSSVEVTSPYSLFSPNEVKIFSFAPGKQTDVARRNLDQGEISNIQPMYCGYHDIQMEPKEKVTSGSSPVTDTPLKPQFCEHFPSTTKSPLLQTQSPAFPVPFHSTPVATKLVYGAQSPRCTPISNAATQSLKRLDNNVGKSALMKNSGVKASSAQGPPLRQRLSQFKFVSPGVQPRRSLPWSSQIEGPSPNNTYGFKVTQVNLQDAKALHEVQHLTLFSLELHVRTRRDARPDPEFDPICAIFYFIRTDTPQPNGKNKITGVICVDSESTNVAPSGIENQENSVCSTENVTRKPPYEDAVASTSTSNLSMSRTLQKTRTRHCRSLLCRTGVTDYDVEYVAEEKQLFPALLEIIRKWDPDILIGYEVQMFSWGFLLERALTFELDLCTHLSRVKGSSSSSNMDAEKDQYGASHSSEIKIAGRIILNVWRLMRHEVTLNSYSFENVAFHVLHERIPLFSFRTLSDWWDHKTSLNRWRTVDHYVRRCRGNVRVLESVDFIGRTSELARLFGILFYSVISRGSQYRVESMMLRIAKPMNYIPVSPSVEQRGAMRAPEVIPLVMEPESRFYSDPVLVLDFQSLYPTMIIAYNYCFSTCLGRVSCLPEYGEFKFGATSLCVPPSLLKKLQGDIHISPNGVAFVKPSVRKGILPSMLSEILQTRIMVKTSMKKWKADKSLGRMLDARQLGLKLIANVTFGYTSAHFSGRMPCVEIGDSIVRKARETLERAIDLVNNTPRWGARVVYGDTDSLFVLLKGATKEQAFSIGKDIVDTVTAMNPKPVKLKFEKVYLPCVLQTKKRYVGYMYETLEQKEPVFDAKGIETVRRDSCPAVAKILEKSLRCLFETRDLSLVKKYVQRQCSKLMEGRASLQDFTFAKEYRGMKNYKPGACVPALELTRRILREDRRSEPRVGERVPYVVVYGSPGLPLIQLVRRPHEVLQDPGLRLNASYYITKQILPPLNRVFSLIGLDVSSWYAELPRVVRVAQMPSDVGNRKKGTISQYFSTLTCPVCQELTHSDLCVKCRAKPQESAVTLISRMRGWERTHQHLAEICYSCCGSRDKLSCVSLDCPVFYKLVQCTRDVKSSLHLRTILESF